MVCRRALLRPFQSRCARFDAFFVFLRHFRADNGLPGHLLINWILRRVGHLILVIDASDRAAYIDPLRQICSEDIDEYLVDVLSRSAIARMESEQKRESRNASLGLLLF